MQASRSVHAQEMSNLDVWTQAENTVKHH